VEERIRDLFASLLEIDASDVTDAAGPNELPAWDSMRHLMLVAGFEEEFGVDVDPEEAVDMYKDFAAFKRVVLQKIARS
jgi:acyl carrier protein